MTAVATPRPVAIRPPSLAGPDALAVPPGSDAVYAAGQWILRAMAMSLQAYRAFGTHHVPRTGGVILAATHQSFLDPPLIGMALPRPVHYMARATLFGRGPIWTPFTTLIRMLRAYPVERETVDAGAVSYTVRLLQAGEAVVMFPEGTRTRTGRINPVRRGLAVLARRANVPVVPVTLAGAYEVWPPGQALPWLRRRIYVAYGPPLPPPPGDRASAVAFGAGIQAQWRQLRARLARAGAVPLRDGPADAGPTEAEA